MLVVFGEPCGTRTHDPLIKSPSEAVLELRDFTTARRNSAILRSPASDTNGLTALSQTPDRVDSAHAEHTRRRCGRSVLRGNYLQKATLTELHAERLWRSRLGKVDQAATNGSRIVGYGQRHRPHTVATLVVKHEVERLLRVPDVKEVGRRRLPSSEELAGLNLAIDDGPPRHGLSDHGAN